ncbi:MAG TPA: hypothetical protein VD966_13215, partial [Pyrinomonadaceae bacterium]|nr:hypothetical protein [Pyrinomonadaceae bacterium]
MNPLIVLFGKILDHLIRRFAIFRRPSFYAFLRLRVCAPLLVLALVFEAFAGDLPTAAPAAVGMSAER